MEDCSELREREAAHSFEEEQAIAAFLGLAYHPQVMAPSYMLIPHHCLSHPQLGEDARRLTDNMMIGKHQHATALRFLRARKMDVKKAYEMFR
jgi:hypothetical protein